VSTSALRVGELVAFNALGYHVIAYVLAIVGNGWVQLGAYPSPGFLAAWRQAGECGSEQVADTAAAVPGEVVSVTDVTELDGQLQLYVNGCVLLRGYRCGHPAGHPAHRPGSVCTELEYIESIIRQRAQTRHPVDVVIPRLDAGSDEIRIIPRG
jgi:hypothetical protein